METKICRKCNGELDRKGHICKLCRQKAVIYTELRQKEETKKLIKEFREQMPDLYEEMRLKVLKELDDEDENEKKD